MRLDHSDVGEQRHVLPVIALRIIRGADGLHHGVIFAVFAPVPEFAEPVAVLEQFAPHGGIELCSLKA